MGEGVTKAERAEQNINVTSQASDHNSYLPTPCVRDPGLRSRLGLQSLMAAGPIWKTSKLDTSKDSRREKWRRGSKREPACCQVFALLH